MHNPLAEPILELYGLYRGANFTRQGFAPRTSLGHRLPHVPVCTLQTAERFLHLALQGRAPAAISASHFSDFRLRCFSVDGQAKNRRADALRDLLAPARQRPEFLRNDFETCSAFAD